MEDKELRAPGQASDGPKSLYHSGHPDALPPADDKPSVVSQTTTQTTLATARWLSNMLGRPFPVESVYPGHEANYLAWVRAQEEA